MRDSGKYLARSVLFVCLLTMCCKTPPPASPVPAEPEPSANVILSIVSVSDTRVALRIATQNQAPPVNILLRRDSIQVLAARCFAGDTIVSDTGLTPGIKYVYQAESVSSRNERVKSFVIDVTTDGIQPPAAGLSDYFPLAVGMTWSFHKDYTVSMHKEGLYQHTRGAVSWTIRSAAPGQGWFRYAVEGAIDDTTISENQRTQRVDTSYLHRSNGGFVLQESADHRLTILNNPDFENGWTDAFGQNVISRYQPTAAPDTVEFHGYGQDRGNNEKVWLTRGRGLVKMWWNSRISFTWYDYTLLQ